MEHLQPAGRGFHIEQGDDRLVFGLIDRGLKAGYVKTEQPGGARVIGGGVHAPW
ncbi:hypothetical protein D3C75_1306640 [compost metagenome]